jgi:hypothetical protein
VLSYLFVLDLKTYTPHSLPLDMRNYEFTGHVVELHGSLMSYGIPIPLDIMESIPKDKKYRLKGTINGIEFDLAINSSKVYGKYLLVNKARYKKAKLEMASALVKFHLVDASILILPEEWEEILAYDEECKERFEAFTPGYQRSLMHYINQAKAKETRIKRAIELSEKVKNRTLYSDRES